MHGIECYFVDGDHSLGGLIIDTLAVNLISRDAVVMYHDADDNLLPFMMYAIKRVVPNYSLFKWGLFETPQPLLVGSRCSRKMDAISRIDAKFTPIEIQTVKISPGPALASLLVAVARAVIAYPCQRIARRLMRRG